MGGRQETREAFLNMNALFTHQVIEERREMIFGREFEVEERSKIMNLGRHTMPLEDAVNIVHKTSGTLGQSFLEAWSGRFYMLQHRGGGCKRERVAYESAGEEGDAGGWIGVIAILPEPAIESIHERGLAGQDANRHATADHLAVSDKIGADAEQGLRAARMDAETRDDFIEDECGPGFCGQLAHRLQELPGTEVRPPALHGLDHYRRQLMDVLFEPGKTLFCPIVQYGDVGDGFGRNTGSDRKHPCNAVANRPSCQHFVELAMIIAGEIDDPVASCHRSRDAHGRHHRFRPGVAKRHPLVASEIAKELCDLACERRLRT